MIPLLVIACYLALLLGLGFVASRWLQKSSQDYLLASRSIGPVLLLMSLFGTTMTAFALVGSTSEAFVLGVGVYGMLASSSGIVHSLCFYLIGVRLWAVGSQYGFTTQIQYFRARLDSEHIGLILFPLLVILVIVYLLIGIVGAGATIQPATRGAFPQLFESTGGGVPAWLGSAVICLVVLTYVFTGGMRATAWANAFQTAVFMILGVVTFYVIAMKLGGAGTLWENLQRASQQANPSRFDPAIIPKLEFASYLLIPLSVGMFPHVFQHWLTARSASAFKLPVVLHPIFILIVWAPCVLLGVWATGSEAAVPEEVARHPARVLGFMVSHFSGGGWGGELLGGLLTAGILAAIMSSLDSQFLCLGTMFANDIVLRYSRAEAFTERQQVWLARGFIVAIVAVSYSISLLVSSHVFDLGIWCFSGFTGLFPLAIAAIYWRRLTRWGAYGSILTVLAAWGYFFWQADFAANKQYVPWHSLSAAWQQTLAGTPLEALLKMLPVASIMLCSTIALVGISLATRPPREATLARFFPPRKSV